MNDTRTLTSENVSLRPSSIIRDMFIVDLHTNPYDSNRRIIIGVGALMPHYDGSYAVYDWTTGVDTIKEDVATLDDAIYTLTQYLSPYTFSS